MAMDEAGTRRSGVGAAAALAAGAVSTVVLAVDGDGEVGGALTDGLSVFGRAHVALAAALLASGLLLCVARRRSVVAGLVAVAGVCAAQLAGAGVVGYRRWPLYWGCCSEPVTEQDLVRVLALSMGVVCCLAALVCLLVLVRGRLLRWNGPDLAVSLAVALVVAVGVPRVAVGGWSDTHELGAWALMYSLPFAAGLVVSGLLDRLAAFAVVVTIAASASLSTVGYNFVYLANAAEPGDAMKLVLGACVLVVLWRLVPRVRRVVGDAPCLADREVRSCAGKGGSERLLQLRDGVDLQRAGGARLE